VDKFWRKLKKQGKRRQNMKKAMATAITVNENHAESAKDSITKPYRAKIVLEGRKSILFHGYNCDAVAAKAAATKGSAEKKIDNPEDFVYRTRDGHLGLNSIMLIQCLATAAKSFPDPRSSRKSAYDLFRAGITIDDEVVPFDGKLKTWDFLDRQRVGVNHSAVTRVRPALLAGWRMTMYIDVGAPQYITPSLLQDVLTDAGKFCGLADYRPVFGTFHVASFERL
jgi:hypothetical protein